MASRNYTPEAANGNRAGGAASRLAPAQGPNTLGHPAHPSMGGAPFFLPTRDSPDNAPLKAQPRTPAVSARGVVCPPDRPDAVGVAVGDAWPRTLDNYSTTEPKPCLTLQPPAVAGAGDARERLRKRARAKGLSQAVAERLVGLGDSTPLRHSYMATLACAGTLRQDGATLAGKYCGNRWCLVCNRIREAKLCLAYGPELKSWGDAWFLTLTLPNVKGAALHAEVRRILKDLKAVCRAVRRTDGFAFRAVRKIEITWSLSRGDYHPHLHLVIDSRAAGDAMLGRWLAMHPNASPTAQDIRPATDLVELFKYTTKLCTKIDGKQTTPPARVLDTIFKALRGLRSVQPMGFKVAPAVEVVSDADGTLELDASTPAPLAMAQPTEWEWLGGAVQDWVNLETGEVLADHTPTPAHQRLLANIANVPDDAYALDGG